MFPNSTTLTGLISALVPQNKAEQRVNLSRRNCDREGRAPPCRRKAPTLDTLNADVFRLIVLELRGGSLRNLASCSRTLRLLASPVLFHFGCRPHLDEKPPRFIRPYIRHLKYKGHFEDDSAREDFESLLDCFPFLTTLTFVCLDHIPWDVIKSCSERPRLTSLIFRLGVSFSFTDAPYVIQDDSGGPLQLTEVSYIQSLWRELERQPIRTMGHNKDFAPMFSREVAALSPLVLRMNSTARQLTLPMETAPVLAMSALPWPQLRELTMYGRYLSDAQPASLPALLSSLPQLQKLSVQICRRTDISRAPILGHHPSPSTILWGLRSLVVAYPDPKDDIFSVDTTGLLHLSLRDWPPYYNRLGYAHRESVWDGPILTSADCLSILQRMALPELSSLHLVYLADRAGADNDLLQYIATAFPKLTDLELHRYRADRDEEVEHIHIARILSTVRSLRTLRLNLDFRDDHGPYCGSYAVRRPWWDRFKGTLGWEIVDIMQDCPLLGCVELLYHGAPTATWVEFHPSRCAEPRFVLSYDEEHSEPELKPFPWFDIDSTGPWSGNMEHDLTPPPEHQPTSDPPVIAEA